MAKWEKIFTSDYCTLPICKCGLEQKIVQQHKLYHFLDKTKYYRGKCDSIYKVCQDEPLNTLEEKRKHQQQLDIEECRAYMPLICNKVSSKELFVENDLRLADNIIRSADRSTLTQMLPLRPIPVKKKEPSWDSYKDMSWEYTTDPPGPEIYYSLVTRFKSKMIAAKILDF